VQPWYGSVVLTSRQDSIDLATRALLALVALMVLLLPVPLGEATASGAPGASCCSLPAADAGCDAGCADPGCAPSLADDAGDGTRDACCAEGCHCACCGALPIALARPGAGQIPCLVRPAPTRLIDARADQVPFTIFVPPRA
jgi:hypothetical protein